MAIIREMIKEDCPSVIDIFNHYVEQSFSAFPEKRIPYAFFDEAFLKGEGYPRIVAEDQDGNVMGFAMLRPHNPIPSFRGTCEITYFIKPGLTGRRLGTLMLRHLLGEARSRGISNILAQISSLNEGSIRFHGRHGFKECGRFMGIGKKKGDSLRCHLDAADPINKRILLGQPLIAIRMQSIVERSELSFKY